MTQNDSHCIRCALRSRGAGLHLVRCMIHKHFGWAPPMRRIEGWKSFKLRWKLCDELLLNGCRLQKGILLGFVMNK